MWRFRRVGLQYRTHSSLRQRRSHGRVVTKRLSGSNYKRVVGKTVSIREKIESLRQMKIGVQKTRPAYVVELRTPIFVLVHADDPVHSASNQSAHDTGDAATAASSGERGVFLLLGFLLASVRRFPTSDLPERPHLRLGRGWHIVWKGEY